MAKRGEVLLRQFRNACVAALLGLGITWPGGATAQGPRLGISPAAREATPVRVLAQPPTYRPNQWKKGLLIGTAVGVVLGVLTVTQCDRDSASDCPGWKRAGRVVVTGAGLGALIGALIPRGQPADSGASK